MSSANLPDLLSTLTDGRFHSGQMLAGQHGISRSAVHQIIHRLVEMGAAIDRIPGKGYRLQQAIELLDKASIHNGLDDTARSRIGDIHVFTEIDSTSAWLLRAAAEEAPSGQVCIAEFQNQGKGRRGNHWVAPLGGSLALSLLWRFEQCDAQIGALSLLVATQLARMLEGAGLKNVQLKWPNDIYSSGRKLGGILLQMVGEVGGQAYIVIGVGINVDIPDEHAASIDQPWTDMKRESHGVSYSRNTLAANTIRALIKAIYEFESAGLQNLQAAWRRYDLCHQRPVRLIQADTDIHGQAAGIDSYGRLLLKTENGTQAYSSGEVSLRPAT